MTMISFDEIDRLLAEKVMGWEIHDEDWCHSEKSGVLGYSHLVPDYPADAWRPTLDIYQAISVWNVMLIKTKEQMNCLRYVNEPKENTWCIDGPKVCIYGKTTELAICFAAMEWLKIL